MKETLFKVTRDWIIDNKTPAGAWTRYQIQALGLHWPPASGWIDEIEESLITSFQAREFEAGKHIKSAVKGSDRKKIMVRVKRLNKHQLNQLGEFLDSISC